tara:strand:- start:2983 stop:3306 length:324 start_codon:yes stop_codon:yes gene_type:complete
MIKKITLTAIPMVLMFLLSSCKSETYDKKGCTDLLFQKYRNTLTLNKTKLFEKKCKNIPIDYSMKTCQKAFGQFFLGVKESTLKKRFGPLIMNCFTKSQIKKVKGKN